MIQLEPHQVMMVGWFSFVGGAFTMMLAMLFIKKPKP